MDIRDYLRVLRKQRRLIGAFSLLAVLVAFGATLTTKKVYESQTQLFVSTQDATPNITGAYQGAQFSQQRVKSYTRLVDAPPITSAVIRDLSLHETSEELGKKITAEAPLDTVLINVAVRDHAPIRAQRIANAVATEFIRVINTIEKPVVGPSPVKVSVVKTADRPETPVSPRPTVNLALGLLVGLTAGVSSAVLREKQDTTVKSVDDFEHLDVAPLGVIALDRNAIDLPLVVHADSQSAQAEAFRQLRTNVQFVDADSRPHSIVVTSSLPGEGKTRTTANLAITLAQAHIRVGLVEGNLRRPKLASYFGIEGAVGLTNVLVEQAELDEALQHWGDGNLLVLPSGATPRNPSELLGSHRMTELLRQLEDRTDIVIIDAPPLLPVTDAAVLSKLADGVLLVVRHGATRLEQLDRAVEALRGVNARIFGAVLNMAPTKIGHTQWLYQGAEAHAQVVPQDEPETGGRKVEAAEQWYRRTAESDDASDESVALPRDALGGDRRADALRVRPTGSGCSRGHESGSVVGNGGDQSSGKYSLRAFGLMFTAGLLLSGALGALFAAHKLGDEPPAPAASSSAAATRSTRPAAPPPCRDNLPQFVHTVRTRVDPDGDELHGVDDVSLVRLGKLTLKQPRVLEDTSLVSLQRSRFVEAANQWLCP